MILFPPTVMMTPSSLCNSSRSSAISSRCPDTHSKHGMDTPGHHHHHHHHHHHRHHHRQSSSKYSTSHSCKQDMQVFCEYLWLSFCIFLRICVLRLRGSAVTLGGAPRGLCCLCICITATHYFSFPNINICVQISPLPASELLMGLWAPLKCILAALIQDTLLLLGCST